MESPQFTAFTERLSDERPRPTERKKPSSWQFRLRLIAPTGRENLDGVLGRLPATLAGEGAISTNNIRYARIVLQGFARFFKKLRSVKTFNRNELQGICRVCRVFPLPLYIYTRIYARCHLYIGDKEKTLQTLRASRKFILLQVLTLQGF